MAVTTLLTPYIGPNLANLIAKGVVSIFDISKKQRENKLDKTFDAFLDENGDLMIGNHSGKDGVGGHHVFSKAGFAGAANYNKDTGFSVSQSFMTKMGWNHNDMTTAQRRLFDELHSSGRENNLLEHVRVAYESLKSGGATDTDAGIVTAMALVDMISKGTIEPSRIPWH